jgi:hypothetical protein
MKHAILPLGYILFFVGIMLTGISNSEDYNPLETPQVRGAFAPVAASGFYRQEGLILIGCGTIMIVVGQIFLYKNRIK